jgi:hypothetical protein
VGRHDGFEFEPQRDQFPRHVLRRHPLVDLIHPHVVVESVSLYQSIEESRSVALNRRQFLQRMEACQESPAKIFWVRRTFFVSGRGSRTGQRARVISVCFNSVCCDSIGICQSDM